MPPPSTTPSTGLPDGQAGSGQATTTPITTATTPSTVLGTSTPSGTITATPAQPIGQTGTTTVLAIPATPAQTSGGTAPPPSTTPPPSGTTPPPSPTPSPTTPSSTADTTAPTITNVQATIITTSGATIIWTTNESADGKVEYGLTTFYGSSFASTTFAISQSIRVSGLQASTAYHYRVISKDAAGNTATGGDYMVTTLAPPSPLSSSGEKRLAKWVVKLDTVQRDITPSLALGSDGTLYVTASGSSNPQNPSLGVALLSAINPNGTIKWNFKEDTFSGSGAAPVIGPDDTIYFTSSVGLRAMNPNGTKKWLFPCSCLARGIALDIDGTIYFAVATGLYAINPDGTKKWFWDNHNNLAIPIKTAPAIGPDGTIYVVFWENILYAITKSGTLKWSYDFEQRRPETPVVGLDGIIYVLYHSSYDDPSNNGLYAFNPDGTKKWVLPLLISRHTNSVMLDINNTIYLYTARFLSQTALERKIYTINQNGTLRSTIVLEDQEILRVTHDAMGVFPVLGKDNIIYIGGPKLIVASLLDGKTKWYFIPEEKYDSQVTGVYFLGPNSLVPIIAPDGTIYMHYHNGYVYAVQSDSNGPADSPWPKFQKNNRNTGNASDPVALQKISQPNLALILQSLSATLDDIQKQIQKLRR